MIQDHPNRPLAHLFRIPCSLVHDPILSTDGVSGNPGAVHLQDLDITLATVSWAERWESDGFGFDPEGLQVPTDSQAVVSREAGAEENDGTALKDILARELEEAGKVLSAAPLKDDADFATAVNGWVGRVQSTIRVALGETEETLFVDNTGLVPKIFNANRDGIHPDDDKHKNQLSHRMQRLRELIQRIG